MNTSQSHLTNDDAHKSPEKLEQEVNQARARMGERLETLSNRLSPGELLDQVMGMAREHGGDFTRNLGSQMKNNPVPLIITGIGMSWLMMSSNTNYRAPYRAYSSRYDDSGQRYSGGYSEYPYRADGSSSDRAGYAQSTSGDSSEPNLADRAKDFADKLGDKVQHATDAAGEKMHAASEAMHRRADSARYGMQQNAHMAQQNMRSAQECMTDFLKEQPVLAASLGVALGAAIGALLPATETEERILGAASEQTIEKAQTLASEQYEKIRETAKDVAEDVKQGFQSNSASGASETSASEPLGRPQSTEQPS